MYRNGWTPVIEGFPKEREVVQVTYLGYNDQKPYCDAFAYRLGSNWFWAESDNIPNVEIIAWKENCEPYLICANRKFVVNTPLGALNVYAKHDVDSPDDYPGVYVELVKNNGLSELLACVEYDSCSKNLQTCVYDKGREEPVEVLEHGF